MQPRAVDSSIIENLTKLRDLLLVDDVEQVIELLIVHFIFSNETPKEFVNSLFQMITDRDSCNECESADLSLNIDFQAFTPKLRFNPFGGDILS
ncbi:hypothetical protein P4H32_31450 [Bacillus cereus]|nr:hypothetical protein [Bacillus cereus]